MYKISGWWAGSELISLSAQNEEEMKEILSKLQIQINKGELESIWFKGASTFIVTTLCIDIYKDGKYFLGKNLSKQKTT